MVLHSLKALSTQLASPPKKGQKSVFQKSAESPLKAHRWTMDEFHNVVAWPEEQAQGGRAGAAEASVVERDEDSIDDAEDDAFEDAKDEEEEEDTDDSTD
ncbi:hypothetical protein LR48_Vigan04g127000 [Vigna angularis]|uniref:Uncharacterized protein n=1 Tax=Phaseolus angularis TaxID=3914 RepID=A0A0L9UEV3_PHAAN|nr:hypothetical protein LR48_Vigan04g127000 [Vigna angularis]